MIHTELRPLTTAEQASLESELSSWRKTLSSISKQNTSIQAMERFVLDHMTWGAILGAVSGLIPGLLLWSIPVTRAGSLWVEILFILAGTIRKPIIALREMKQRKLQAFAQIQQLQHRLERNQMEVLCIDALGAVEIQPSKSHPGHKLPLFHGAFLVDIGDGKALFLCGDHFLEFTEGTMTWEDTDAAARPTTWHLTMERYVDEVDALLCGISDTPYPPLSRTVYWRDYAASRRLRNGDILHHVSLATLETDRPDLFLLKT